MANHTATKKAIRKTKSQTSVNRSRIKRIRTFIRKVEIAAKDGDANIAKSALTAAQSEIMRGVTKNVIKKNTAARRVSRLAKLVKNIDSTKSA